MQETENTVFNLVNYLQFITADCAVCWIIYYMQCVCISVQEKLNFKTDSKMSLSEDSSLLDVNVVLLGYLTMKALLSFEMSANIYNPIWHNILGDSNYQQHRCENLWSHIVQPRSFSRLSTCTGLQSVPYRSSKVTYMRLFGKAICLPKHATLGLITGISHAMVQKKSTPTTNSNTGNTLFFWCQLCQPPL